MEKSSSSENGNGKPAESALPSASDKKDPLPTPQPLRKAHHVTVCMVPPPCQDNQHVWEVVSRMRRQMKDPGFYRWPHHANLLYPFLEVGSKKQSGTNILQETVAKLHAATRQVEPFTVVLKELGTFGGKQRGVLWLKPESSLSTTTTPASTTDDDNDDTSPPLHTLHQKLEEAFPMCKDSPKPVFTPHMTVSHFCNLTDALAAQKQIEADYPQLQDGSLTFVVDRIYLLRRDGDEGQFRRLADIGLGATSTVDVFADGGAVFPDMPTTEEPWVYQERMKLKNRRNGGRGRGGRRKQQRKQQRRSKSPRVTDAPEVIEAKRAARKAKRERLEQEQQQQQQPVERGDESQA